MSNALSAGRWVDQCSSFFYTFLIHAKLHKTFFHVVFSLLDNQYPNSFPVGNIGGRVLLMFPWTLYIIITIIVIARGTYSAQVTVPALNIRYSI